MHHPALAGLLGGEGMLGRRSKRERQLEDLIASINLYIGRYVETQLTTEQKELLYDIVEADYKRQDIYSSTLDRWWR